MTLRDMLRKKEKLNKPEKGPPVSEDDHPQFTFMRSDTISQEIISPPSFPREDPFLHPEPIEHGRGSQDSGDRSFLSKLRPRSASTSSRNSAGSPGPRSPSRFSQRLGLSRESTSVYVPSDLPAINSSGKDEAGVESEWEQRATLLARENEKSRPGTPTGSSGGTSPSFSSLSAGRAGAGSNKHAVSSQNADDNIQEAIRLHEAGDLETATRMFGRLADPNGENNALSQVLYGLALRHGWGCIPNTTEAVTYLSAAASNAASIEDLALQAGMKKGGAAKGELVLAIFELANCFRHGWGVQKDSVAAQRYYETAANLGDTDAMNEAGWCYVEGFGCKKDKYKAARYYRLAEQAGNKTLGNSWIWKDKYNTSAA